MSYRPYPSRDRARHQIDRHDDETAPLCAPHPPSPMERTLIEYASAAVRSATPALASLITGMRPANRVQVEIKDWTSEETERYQWNVRPGEEPTT